MPKLCEVYQINKKFSEKKAMKKNLSKILLQLLMIMLLTSIAYADFGLHLASFKTKQSAEKEVKRLDRQNQNAFIDEIDLAGKGIWYRVCLGHFSTRKKAIDQTKIMRSNGFDGYIGVVKINMKNVVPTESIHKGENKEVRNNVAQKFRQPILPSPKSKPDSQPKKPTSSGRRDFTLTWDPAELPDLAGYKIYYGTYPGPPYDPDKIDYAEEGPPPIIVGSNVTEITLHGLTESKDYFFAITSFDTKGLESDYSAEITTRKTIPPQKDPSVDEPAEGKWAAKSEQLPSDPALTMPDISPKDAYKPLTPADSSKAASEEPLISAGDILWIDVPGQPQMTNKYDVDPNGDIFMVIVGRISVQDLSPAALNDKLMEKLKKYITKGTKITVQVLERKRYINIRGGVLYPGWYRVPQMSELDDLMKMAGGLIPGVDIAKIKLERSGRDRYKKVGKKGKISLHPNDILVVPIPKEYHQTVDAGDLLFASIPQRQAPGRTPSRTDIADLAAEKGQNQVEVDRNGYIYIPNYGHIYVKDVIPSKIQQLITERLPKYIAILEKVRASIVEKRQYVQVLGHVTNPGWYNVPEMANVQEALNTAGGAVDGAVMSNVSIHRKRDWGIEEVKVNLSQFSITGDARLLTPLQENDILFVPISDNFGDVKRTLSPWSPPPERLEEDVKKKVRIFGAVSAPGVYEFEDDMNLLDILVKANGETQWAEMTDILIIRNEKVEVKYNFEEFLKSYKEGARPLPKLRSGDTVYVTMIETTTKEAQDRIFLLGEINSPASYELWDNMTVLQALAWAGGLTEWADSDNIMILRTVGGKQENIPYNYDRGIRGRAPEVNIRLHTNDVIIVP